MEDVVTVLDVGERTLSEWQDVANCEHRATESALVESVEHAIRAGHALAQIQRQLPAGSFGAWLVDGFDGSQGVANIYMRMAEFAEVLRAWEVRSVKDAKRRLTLAGLTRSQPGNRRRVPVYDDSVRTAALELMNAGLSARKTARIVGVTSSTVLRWVNPEYEARQRQSVQETRQKRVARERVAREIESQREVKRAVRKAGGAMAELYVMAERMQDVLAQAHRESATPEAARALALAGQSYRKMRDEIVRALGVS